MRFVREIWERDPLVVRYQMTKDKRFQEFFGCSAVVSLLVWRRLKLILQVPYGGKPNYLLWALLFMKVYPKEGMMCTLIHVKDPKSFRGKVRYFIFFSHY